MWPSCRAPAAVSSVTTECRAGQSLEEGGAQQGFLRDTQRAAPCCRSINANIDPKRQELPRVYGTVVVEIQCGALVRPHPSRRVHREGAGEHRPKGVPIVPLAAAFKMIKCLG